MGEFFKKLGADLFDRVIVSNKSTIIGWALGGAVYAADAIAQSVAGWHSPYAPAIAIALGFVGTALKNKAKAEAYRAAAAQVIEFKPPMVPPATLALLIGGTLLLAAPARAQDTGALIPPPPASTGTAPFHPWNLGKGYTVDPFAGMGGSVFDVAHGSVARNYTFGIGLELRKAGVPIGLAVSGNAQLGDIIGGSGTGGFTLADPAFGLFQDFGLGVNVAVVSKIASWGPTVFKVWRFSAL